MVLFQDEAIMGGLVLAMSHSNPKIAATVLEVSTRVHIENNVA